MFTIDRRRFLSSSAALAVMASIPAPAFAKEEIIEREAGVKLKLGLNAYSFNKQLRDGSMTLADTVHFCAKQGVDALDATGYYFPGYPNAPTDEYIYNLKRVAFVNGVAISGTGVHNDFAVPDPAARKKDVQLIKDWIVVASKLGAPVIRVFSGSSSPAADFEKTFPPTIPQSHVVSNTSSHPREAEPLPAGCPCPPHKHANL
jgi:sugar phosphate isomerase/epimerase